MYEFRCSPPAVGSDSTYFLRLPFDRPYSHSDERSEQRHDVESNNVLGKPCFLKGEQCIAR